MDSSLALRLFRILKLHAPIRRQNVNRQPELSKWLRLKAKVKAGGKVEARDVVEEKKDHNTLTIALERSVNHSLFTRDKFITLADMCTEFKISDLAKD